MEIRRTNVLVVAVFFIFGIGVYYNSFFNLFVFDDYLLILQNEAVKSWSFAGKIFQHDLYYFVSNSNFYRPLVSLSLMLDFSIWKFLPFGYHLTNTVLHIANATLVFFLLRKLFDDDNLAFIAGALFLCHPVHTQAVTYISGRGDLLGMFFSLAAMNAFFVKEPKVSTGLISAFLFFLAVISKESYLIVPVLIFLCMRMFHPGDVRYRKRLFLIVGVVLAYCLARATLLKFSPARTVSIPLAESLLNLPLALTEYIMMLVLPLDLHIERTLALARGISDPRLISAILLVLFLAVLLLRLRRRQPVIFFASLWFLIALLPVTNILFPLNALIAEHWLYLASVGFFVLAAFIIIQFSTVSSVARRIALAVFCTLIFYFSVLTMQQNAVWRNEVTLYSHALQFVSPQQSGRLHYNLACAYLDLGLFDDAIREYEIALRYGTDYSLLIYHNLARAHDAKGEKQKALELWKRALGVKPNNRNDEQLLQEIRQFLQRREAGDTSLFYGKSYN